METVKVSVKSVEKASRLELFIRFIWGFIVYIVLMVIGIFVALAVLVQWLHILIVAKRHASLAKFINSWLAAYVGLTYYMDLATDERPPLIPDF